MNTSGRKPASQAGKFFSYKLTIGGQEYTIRSDEREEYVRKLAAFVDKKMETIRHKSPGLPRAKVAMLAALQIADELYKFQDNFDALINLIEEEKKSGRVG